MSYMTADHPQAFIDWAMMEPGTYLNKQCQRCKGHGGWNLQLFAYSMPRGYEDTAENRHRYRHFRSVCDHCNGWGYVGKDETCTGHEWINRRNVGRCLNEYTCKHCNKVEVVDSSD
jgi:hypothetical protein